MTSLRSKLMRSYASLYNFSEVFLCPRKTLRLIVQGDTIIWQQQPNITFKMDSLYDMRLLSRFFNLDMRSMMHRLSHARSRGGSVLVNVHSIMQKPNYHFRGRRGEKVSRKPIKNRRRK